MQPCPYGRFDSSLRLHQHIGNHMKILFITGAGISAPSGLPTYRGPGGLYGDDPVEDGYRIDEILSREVANKRPDLFAKYHGQIQEAISKVKPNAMHREIAALEARGHFVHVYTQNIDDLHERAGTKNITHLHGGGAANEPVVLFGDMLPAHKIQNLYERIPNADIVCVVGTSSVFDYIRQPVRNCKMYRKTVILLDPDPMHPLAKYCVHRLDKENYANIIKSLPILGTA